MKERLLLDRVDIMRNHLVIHEAVKGAVHVFPYGTDASFPGRDEASVAAEAALHLVPFLRLLEHCLLHKSIPCMKPDEQDSRFFPSISLYHRGNDSADALYRVDFSVLRL